MTTTTNTTTLAWHNDPDLKARTLAALRDDHAHDRLIRGQFAMTDPQMEYRGCMVGCLVAGQLAAAAHLDGNKLIQTTLDTVDSWHEEVSRRFGIPRPLAYLWDSTFERLPAVAAPAFAIEAVESVPVGADLSLVVSRLLVDVLGDPGRGVLRLTAEGSRQRAAVESVLALYVRRLAGDEPAEWEWRAAYAYAAAGAAAATYAYAAAAAYAAAGAYAYAYAADAAAAAAAAGAYRGHWEWIAERLIHHTQTAPMTDPITKPATEIRP